MRIKSRNNYILLICIILSVIYIIISYKKNELNSSSYEDIDHYISEKMDEIRIPGVSLGIVKGNDIYVKGYGKSDSSGNPVTENTPFLLGSTTKSITAAAIMQLVEQGKIELDEKVTAYLPDFRFRDKNMSDLITVRQLLNQISGIATSAGGSDYLDGKSTRKDFINGLRNTDLTANPGKEFQYAEANYVILGEIITSVSGQSYEEYIEDHIFKPLDMGNSFTNKKEARAAGLTNGNITWFGYPFETDLTYPKQYTSASALYSSANDLTHYIKLIMNDGKYNSQTILSKESMDEIIRPSVSLKHPAGYSYGMGWFINNTIIMHNGCPTNYYSILLIKPKSKTGVVLLANVNNRIITGEYIMPIAYEILNKLTDNTVPSGTRSLTYRQLYKIINLLFLWVIFILIYRFVKVIRTMIHKGKTADVNISSLKMILPDILIFTFTFCLFSYLLTSYGVSIKIAYLGQPDITLCFCIILLLSVINIISKSIFIYRYKK